MSSPPWHPMVVHLPMALAVLVPLFALAILVGWWSGRIGRRAWWFVVALQAITVLSGMAALRTGESEEDRVEHVVNERVLDDHEDAAESFVTMSGVTLLVVGAAGFVAAPGPALGLGVAGFLCSVAGLGLGIQTGAAGGRLVYEFGAASVRAPGSPGAAPGDLAQRSDHHDDDEEDDD